MAHLERYETAMAVQANRDRIALAESAKIEADQKIIESETERLETMRRNRDLKLKTFSEYKVFVKDTLLQYVIEALMEDAVHADTMNEHDIKLMHHFTSTFVKESGGASSILFKAGKKTPLLEEITDAVEDTSKEIIDKADKDDPATLAVNRSDIMSCVSKLNQSEDFQTAKELIARKVLAAEDEFINSHKQDKAAMDAILQGAEEKIAAVDNDLDMKQDTKEAIKQETANLAKRKIMQIRENKSRGVFDEMVRRYSKSVIGSDVLREHYMAEGADKIDTAKIVDSIRCMYAVLETFSTVKLEKIDENYIKNILEEI